MPSLTPEELAQERARSLVRQKRREAAHEREWRRTHAPRQGHEDIIVGRRARKVGELDFLPPRTK